MGIIITQARTRSIPLPREPPQKDARQSFSAFVLVSLSWSTRLLNSGIGACVPMALATPRRVDIGVERVPQLLRQRIAEAGGERGGAVVQRADRRSFGGAGAAAPIERRDIGIHLVDRVLGAGGQRVTRGAHRPGRERLLPLGLPDARRRRRGRHRRGHRLPVGRGDVRIGRGRAVGDGGTSRHHVDQAHQHRRDTAERQRASPGEVPTCARGAARHPMSTAADVTGCRFGPTHYTPGWSRRAAATRPKPRCGTIGDDAQAEKPPPTGAVS